MMSTLIDPRIIQVESRHGNLVNIILNRVCVLCLISVSKSFSCLIVCC